MQIFYVDIYIDMYDNKMWVLMWAEAEIDLDLLVANHL